jgi:hypothetical protein
MKNIREGLQRAGRKKLGGRPRTAQKKGTSPRIIRRNKSK